jgi:hypothetical protein
MDVNTTGFVGWNGNGCSLAVIHDLGCNLGQFFELPALSMGDLQGRSESVRPIRAMFAEQPW